MMHSRCVKSNWLLFVLFAGLATVPCLLGASETSDSAAAVYRLPSPAIVDVIDAPLPPWVLLNPDRDIVVLLDWQLLTTMGELAAEELRLAGLRINPATRGRSRQAPSTGISLMPITGGDPVVIAGLPAEPRLEHFAFSPDGSRIVFTHTCSDGIELWVLDVKEAGAHRVIDANLTLTTRIAPAWINDETLLCALTPEGLGPRPTALEYVTESRITKALLAPFRTRRLLSDPILDLLRRRRSCGRWGNPNGISRWWAGEGVSRQQKSDTLGV